jgi:hypothetical protein
LEEEEEDCSDEEAGRTIKSNGLEIMEEGESGWTSWGVHEMREGIGEMEGWGEEVVEERGGWDLILTGRKWERGEEKEEEEEEEEKDKAEGEMKDVEDGGGGGGEEEEETEEG